MHQIGIGWRLAWATSACGTVRSDKLAGVFSGFGGKTICELVKPAMPGLPAPIIGHSTRQTAGTPRSMLHGQPAARGRPGAVRLSKALNTCSGA